MPTKNYTLDRIVDDEHVQIELEVDYDIDPYVPAVMPSLNYPGDPPEGGGVTDFVAYDEDGKPFSLDQTKSKS